MKLLTLTKVSDLNNPGFLQLKKSLDKFNYDYRVIHDTDATQFGNGHKALSAWLKEHKGDYTHFLFTDGFDTLAFGPAAEVIEKYKDVDYWLYSSEKACYPRGDWADKHEPCATPWRFINGGQMIAPIDLYIQIVETIPRGAENDQEWAMANFLFRGCKIKVETACEIFQTVGFEDTNDFALTRDGRLLNRKTNTLPVLAHGNGKTDMTWLYEFTNRITY